MADKDDVKVGDIVEVVVAKPIQGKMGKEYESKGWAKPNRMGQRAKVSGLKQVSKKTGKTNWTTKKDGKILIKYIDYTHADGFDVPGQTQGKPPVLNDGEWKIVEVAEVPEGAERARNDEGEYVGDDPYTDDTNEAFVGGFGGIGGSTPEIDTTTPEEALPLPDEEEESTTAPVSGFGGIAGFGGIGGSPVTTPASPPSGGGKTSTPAPPKPKKKKSTKPVFDMEKAGWMPFENTMELDMEKVKATEGSYSKTIAGLNGYKVRVLFSPITNGFGDEMIDTEAKMDDMKENVAKMILREYEIGKGLQECEIRGSGSSNLKPISQNYGEGADAEPYPSGAQVQSFTMKWNKQGKLQELVVSLLVDGDIQTLTHKLQTATWNTGGAGGGMSGFGSTFGSSSSSAGVEYKPPMDAENKFYNPDSVRMPHERYDMELRYDSDNTIFKDLWKPVQVDWDKAPSIPIKMEGFGGVSYKNIGGYVKITMSCAKVEDVTDRIPGVWEGYTASSKKNDWSNTPRRVTLIFPKADDTNMYWEDDDGQKMSQIDEVKYHTIRDKIHSIRLTANVQRNKKDADGKDIVNPETYEVEKEDITQHKLIEKGRDYSFEVKNRIGKQGYQTLKGEIESIKVYPDGDCWAEWEKWRGQRESFLTYGEQTISWLRWRNEKDENSLYIIVANDNDPNTGQVIVLTKKTLEEAEEEMEEEVEEND